MTIQLLERAGTALGDLREEVVFVGGATVTLWITDEGAPPPRPTKDVDVVVEVGSRRALHDFEGRLRAQGFREDQESGIICRWRYGEGRLEDDLLLDVIPTEAGLIGFTNRWFGAAVPAADTRELPSGASIRVVAPPYLVATKLEAFSGRGAGDYLGSRDLEDIVTLVDGREELVAEVTEAAPDLRAYLAGEIETLLGASRFIDAVFGLVRPDIASQDRVERLILPRLRAIAGRPGP